MRMARFVGPVILVCVLALGACSTTSGTAQRDEVPTQESADTTDEGTTTMPAPPENAVDGDTEPSASGKAFGTRDAPLSPDTEVGLGAGWTVAVGATNLDAWSQIREMDSLMEEPEAGRVFVSARLAMAFNGAGSADPGFEMSHAFIGSKGNTFPESDNCAPYDIAIWSIEEMYSGAKAEAVLCISVPEDQAEGGVWRIQLGSMESSGMIDAYFSTS